MTNAPKGTVSAPDFELEYLEMTLGMVVHYDGGFLVAADSAASETTWGFREPFPKSKIMSLESCAIVYAGNSDWCRRTLKAACPSDTASSSPYEVARSISRTAKKAWKRRFKGGAQFAVVGFDEQLRQQLFYLSSNERFTINHRSDSGCALVGRWVVADYFMSRFLAYGMTLDSVAKLAVLAFNETTAVLEGIDMRLQGVLVTPEASPKPFDFTAALADLRARGIRFVRTIDEWLHEPAGEIHEQDQEPS